MTDARKLWTSGSKVPVHVDAKEIAERARKLGRRMFWSNAKEYVGGVLVVVIFTAYAVFPGLMDLPPVSRIGSVLTAVGCTFVMAYLWLRGGRGAEDLPWEGTTLGAYRKLLQRRRDLLRDVPRWYLGPFVPGIVVFMTGLLIDERAREAWPAIVVTIVISVATFVGIALLNRSAARKLDAELAALPPDETSAP